MCAHIRAVSPGHRSDIETPPPPVTIDAAGPTEAVDEAARRAWPVRREEFMMKFLFVWADVLFYSCLISMWTVTFTYGACVCVGVFYSPRRVSLCHEIRNLDQHGFEAGRTSVKLIVPLHLRPALVF